MDKRKIEQTLGMATKAGALIFGVRLFEAIKKQKVYLVISATDMGASQKKKLTNQCQHYQIPLWDEILSRQEIAQACGKTQVVAVGITDINLFQLIKKYN